MKLYFYPSKININSYFIVNEKNSVDKTTCHAKCKEGILLDPIRINEHLIEKIENEGVLLKMVLLTQSGDNHILHGKRILEKVYNFQSFSASSMKRRGYIRSQIYKNGDFQVEAYPVKMGGKDVCMYKIGGALFTGLPFLDSFVKPPAPSFLEKIEREKLQRFLLELSEKTICFPFSGPPFTIKSFKFYANN